MRRRDAFARLAAGALAASCAPPPDGRVRVPLEALPLGGRTVVTWAGGPVELVRTREGVSARSLLCPHFGCRVHWVPESQRYRCPCHEGWFDAEGRPLAGPPTRRLRPVGVVVERDTALVGEP